MTPGLRAERWLLAAGIIGCLCLSGLHFTSRIATGRTDDAPLVAWLSLNDFRYLLIYSWNERILNLVAVGSEVSNLPSLDRAPAFTLHAQLPAAYGRSDSPEAAKAWLSACPRDARFWLSLSAALAALRRRSDPPLGFYDAALLLFEAYRLKRSAIRIAWLPPAPENRPFLELLLSSSPSSPRPAAIPGERPGSVTIQVLNASGDGGVALQVTKVLRWRKADVVDFGNAPTAADKTHFFDRTGDFGAAEDIRRTLGCGGAEVMTRIEPAPRATVTVVLGRDYRNCRSLADLPQN